MPTIADLEHTNPELYQRIIDHLGEEALSWTTDEIAHYWDGEYGGPADPRGLPGMKAAGELTAWGGSGPK